MTILHILLIPLKLIIKLIGAILTGIFYLIGHSIINIFFLVSLPLKIIGSLGALAFVVLVIMNYTNPDMQSSVENPWLMGALGVVVSTIIGGIGFFGMSIGEFIIGIGENIWFYVACMELLP